MEDSTKKTCRAFADALASAEPTPGGGGAAALTGALAASLGSMVANLTVGKKKYAAVQAEVEALRDTCVELRDALLDLVQADAECFAPLAAAYRMDAGDPARAETLERATENACTAPMAIMARCCAVIDASARLAEIGSRLALSDAGCAASLAKAALESASLNVFINTAALQNREKADAISREAEKLVSDGCAKAQKVFSSVRDTLKGGC